MSALGACFDSLCSGRSRYYKASRDKNENCIFCRIPNSEPSESNRVIFQNERLIVFPDIRPAAAQHFLVVPRDHIANTDSLMPSDLALVQEMREVGERLIRERSKPGATVKFGYHVPPFRSVDHLHLHCFELPHKPWKSWKYSGPLSPWWLTSDELVDRLRRCSWKEDFDA